ncbi:hypothetical protein PQX77_019157 [Marasmius sp. AFHP31]|nr:hypothetical protein PQX77_019157 [Marasmius sp. AFHP31]
MPLQSRSSSICPRAPKQNGEEDEAIDVSDRYLPLENGDEEDASSEEVTDKEELETDTTSYKFDPKRWIKDGKMNSDIRDVTSGFEVRRRICPGKQLTMSTIYLMIMSMLAVFDISKAVNENGKLIEPNTKFTSNSIVNFPELFKCSIKPRSAAHERLAWKAVGNIL